MKLRTHRLRRVAAAVALGVGMVGGVIGVAAGTAGATPVAPTATFAAHATTTPTIKPATSGQAAGNWTITITGAATSVWKKTTKISFTVFNHAGTNCNTTTGSVLVTGTPTVTAKSTHASTTPTFTVTTKPDGTTCTTATDEVTVKLTNTGHFTGKTAKTNKVTLTVSGVKYTTHKGSAEAYGDVAVTVKMTATTLATKTTTPATTTGVSNANIEALVVSGNTPAVSVAPKAIDASISPISVSESTPDAVTAGYYCISLTPSANVFNTAGKAKAAASPTGTGAGTVTTKVFYETTTGAKVGATTKTAKYAVFDVKTASTAKATTYTVSGLAVNAANAPGSTVKAVVAHAKAATKCVTAGVGATIGTHAAYTIAVTSTQVYGATADATAAAEFSRVFPYTTGTCPGSRKAVIATTVVYQDALSSQYLAKSDGTGTLLTPTTSLSTVTATELRLEGINHVTIVGGPLAVSDTVMNAISKLHVYNCGGTVESSTTITVTRIFGATQYGTAKAVVEHVGTAAPSIDVKGAYTTPTATPNSSGGTGRYNDTAGKGTTAKTVTAGAKKTAILASGTEFQDAQAASVIAYHTSVPMLLTSPTALSTTAVAALKAKGIQQVILMGGQLAVTNTVVKSLETKTGADVTVLRVAGKDYTDTARELATFELTAPGATFVGLGWTAGARLLVARGNGFTDGIAGAVLDSTTNASTGAKHEHPLLLTETPTVPGPYLTTFLKIAGTGGSGIGGNHISSLTILGGPKAVSPAAIADMKTDLNH